MSSVRFGFCKDIVSKYFNSESDIRNLVLPKLENVLGTLETLGYEVSKSTDCYGGLPNVLTIKKETVDSQRIEGDFIAQCSKYKFKMR